MRERLRLRRFGGLTTVFLGLTGVFASLTLGAQGSVSWAALSASVGFLAVVVGLRLLPRPTS
jgi:hypothetical protein